MIQAITHPDIHPRLAMLHRKYRDLAIGLSDAAGDDLPTVATYIPSSGKGIAFDRPIAPVGSVLLCTFDRHADADGRHDEPGFYFTGYRARYLDHTAESMWEPEPWLHFPVSAVTYASVHDAMKAVRTLMKFARDRGWLSYDPAAGYEFPKREVGPIIVFSADELSKIYADEEDGMCEIWRFYTETCLRANELTWLLKDDVILNEDGRPAAIHIRKKVCPQTGEKWQPKHAKERIVPLTARAATILTQAMSTSKVYWAFQSPIPNDTQPVMWTYQRMKDRLQRRLKEVGIAKCGLHRFRHTGATYLANDARVPIVKLQRFLGHGDIKETMRYLNPRAEHVADAIQSVDFDALIDPDNAKSIDTNEDVDVDEDADGKK